MKKIFIAVAGVFLLGTVFFFTINSSQKEMAIQKLCSSDKVQDPQLIESVDFIYEKFRALGFNIKDVRPCINMQFVDLKSNGGPFAKFSPANNSLNIEVDTALKGKSLSLVSAYLVHEVIHAAQYLDDRLDSRYPMCIDNEVEAFFYQIYFISNYNQDQANEALYASDNVDSQTLKSIYSTLEAAKQSCSGKDKAEFSQCVSKTLKDDLKSKIVTMDRYKNQCQL